MINKKIDEFIQCIDAHKFYEAHEVLEELWFPKRFEKTPEIELQKGFINAAVSFELIKRGRIPQSKRVWATYLKYRQHLYKVNPQNKNLYLQLTRYLEHKQITLLSHYFGI